MMRTMMERREMMRECCKVLGLLMLLIVALCTFARAAECTVSLDWDGKDSLGNTEQSLPVTFEVIDADTLDVLTSAQVNGAVSAFKLPSFTYMAPDNKSVVLRLQATAKDAKGNKSLPSQVVSATIVGKDTMGPLAPQITISIGGNE